MKSVQGIEVAALFVACPAVGLLVLAFVVTLSLPGHEGVVASVHSAAE